MAKKDTVEKKDKLEEARVKKEESTRKHAEILNELEGEEDEEEEEPKMEDQEPGAPLAGEGLDAKNQEPETPQLQQQQGKSGKGKGDKGPTWGKGEQQPGKGPRSSHPYQPPKDEPSKGDDDEDKQVPKGGKSSENAFLPENIAFLISKEDNEEMGQEVKEQFDKFKEMLELESAAKRARKAADQRVERDRQAMEKAEEEAKAVARAGMAAIS